MDGVLVRPLFDSNGKDLAIERLRSVLAYNAETGIFTWKASLTNATSVASVAGSKSKSGYISIQLDGRLYRANRLAWFYAHGRWPDGQIDHKNRVKTDNRLCNLRDVTCAQNQGNSKRRVDNRSGYKGVSFHKATGKWSSTVQHEGRRIHLGVYETPESAARVYADNLHRLKGEFARTA